tara:strand:+ start:819 stop:1286 length:468 start_codon:yes stop_codon:yes gene_type:complete
MVLSFSLTIPSPAEKIKQKITDFKNLKNYMPLQIEEVRIIKNEDELKNITLNENQVVTEEIITSKAVLKTRIKQRSLQTINDNSLVTKIIEGPAEGTTIKIDLEQQDEQTKISISIEPKLKMKYFFLKPLIGKEYKKIFTAILYRINTEIMSENE